MKDIQGFEGLYAITEDGRVWSYPKQWTISHGGYRKAPGHFQKQKLSNGYPAVSLCKNGKAKWIRVHRLLATTYIPNPNNYRFINHKNGIKTDFALGNLEWCNASHNMRHAFAIGLKTHKGENGPKAILTNSDVIEIRRLIAEGHYHKDIAPKFGVSRSAIAGIACGRTWSHLTNTSSERSF